MSAPVVSLVLVLGLPGAGKTTLCKKIESQFKSIDTKVLIVSFDDHLPIQDLESLQENNLTLGNWKLERKKILSLTEEIVRGLKDQCEMDMVKTLFPDIFSTKYSQYIIFLDDNFYYRSMRYEYLQIARKYQLGFLQVLVNCELNKALLQNKQREHVIPDEIILKMSDRFENPLLSSDAWEKSTISVTDTSDLSLDLVYKTALQSLKSPVKSVENTQEIADAARVVCSRNVIHQADLILRKLVSETIKKYKSTESSPSVIYQKANTIKQSILSSLNSGELILPVLSATELITDVDKELLKVCISDTFSEMWKTAIKSDQ